MSLNEALQRVFALRCLWPLIQFEPASNIHLTDIPVTLSMAIYQCPSTLCRKIISFLFLDISFDNDQTVVRTIQ